MTGVPGPLRRRPVTVAALAALLTAGLATGTLTAGPSPAQLAGRLTQNLDG